MNILKEILYKLSLPRSVPIIKDLMEDWEPGNFNHESGYRDSLYRFLDKEFRLVDVKRRYSEGKVSPDITVGDNVFMEIYKDFDKDSDLQGLKTKIDNYKDEYKEKGISIIVLLVGDADTELIKELQQYLEESFDPILFFGEASRTEILVKNINYI